MRLDLAPRLGAVAAGVGEAQAFGVPAAGGEDGQVLGIDCRAAAGHRDHRLPERGDSAAKARGQHLLELHQRADRRLLDPGHRRLRRGPKPDRDRDRLVVVEQQRRHRGAGAQRVAAGGAGERLDRVAEVAEPLDVAADRAAGDLEPARQLGAGPVAPRLEQREQGEEAAGGLVHAGSILLDIEDRS